MIMALFFSDVQIYVHSFRTYTYYIYQALRRITPHAKYFIYVKVYIKNIINCEICSIFQTDASTAFLRAARAGQLDKILALLNQDVDINVSNAVSKIFKNVLKTSKCIIEVIINNYSSAVINNATAVETFREYL